MIYTAIETSPNACIGKPYLLKLLLNREPTCIVYRDLYMLELCIELWTGFQYIFFFLFSVLACLKEKTQKINPLATVYPV